MKKPILLLLFIGVLVYGNALFNGFVWDDEELIVNNVQIQSLANTPQFFAGSTFNSGGGANLAGLYYKPLMTVAFSFLYTVFGPNPFWFHLGQISLHLANAVLLYLIFRRFLSPSLALGAALIFLVHPINTEAVVYLADYQEVLFFFFGALAFLLVLKGNTYAGLFILPSLLSKETGAVFAVIIVVYLVFFEKEKRKQFFIMAAVSFIMYGFLRFGVAGIYFNKHGLTPMSLATLPERLVNIPAIFFFYLKTFFWPADLTINQQWMVKNIAFVPAFIDIGFLSILSYFGYFIYKKRQGIFKLWVFFFVWFLVGMALHLQIFPLDLTVSDRWFYLPQVGLLGMGGVWVTWAKWDKCAAAKIVFLLVVLALGLRTIGRTFDWRDGYTLYRHDIAASPDAFDLQNNLGVEIFRRGDVALAKKHFVRSIELSPKWWTNWSNLGAVLEREKDFAGAKHAYETAIANGGYFLAYENLAQTLLFHESTPSALLFTQNALTIFPNNSRLWQTYALAHYFSKNFAQATAAARRSYVLLPNQQNSYIFSRLSQNLPLAVY